MKTPSNNISPRSLDIIREIIRTSKWLYRRGYVVGNSGNISGKISDNIIIIKRTGIRLSEIKPKDLILTRLNSPDKNVSSDFFIHREIYLNLPKIKYVIHAHPPYIVKTSLKFDILKTQTYEGKKLFGNEIPIITCNHHDIPSVINFNYFKKFFIDKGHGVYVYGEKLEELVILLEELEYTARMMLQNNNHRKD